MADYVIVTGDLHLKRVIWNTMPTLAGDTYVAFSQIVNDAISLKKEGHNVKVVIAGDIFDSKRPNSEAVAFFDLMVGNLLGEAIPCYCVDGNHDKVDSYGGDKTAHPTYIKHLETITAVEPSWAGVSNINEQVIELLPGIKAYGLNYQTSAVFQQKVANIPADVQVLIAHQMWDWSMPVEGRHNAKASWVPEYVKTVLCGDDHTPKEHTENGTTFIYTGSPCMLRLSETHSKSYVLLTLDADNKIRFTRVKLQSRPYFEALIHDEAELDVFIASIPEMLNPDKFKTLAAPIQRPLVKVTYNTDVVGIYSRLQASLNGFAHVKLAAYSLTMFAAKVADVDSDALIDASTTLATFFNLPTDGAVYELAAGLLQTTDSEAINDRLTLFKAKLGLTSGGD